MKKFLRKYWLIIAIWLAINIGFTMAANKIRDDYVQRSVDNAYVQGFEKGVNSVSLSDLCKDPEKTGFGTDFTEGYAYDIIRCKVNFRDWRNDWIIEEDPVKGLEGATQQI